MLAARAEGVGQLPDRAAPVLPPGRDLRDPRRPDRPGLDPPGHGQLRLPDRDLGRRAARPGRPGRRTATPGAPTSASGARAALAERTRPSVTRALRRHRGPSSDVDRRATRCGRGPVLSCIESMKMEQSSWPAAPGTVRRVEVAAGDAVLAGESCSLIDEDGARSTTRPTHAGDAIRRRRRRRRASAPSWPSCRPGWPPPSTPGGPAATGGATPAGGARPGRTSRTCAIPAASRSTAAWSSRPSGPGAAVEDLDRPHPGRRPGGRHRPGQRRPLRR